MCTCVQPEGAPRGECARSTRRQINNIYIVFLVKAFRTLPIRLSPAGIAGQSVDSETLASLLIRRRTPGAHDNNEPVTPTGEATLEQRLHIWAKASGCRLCVLFGSQADALAASAGAGTANASPSARSDIDIAIQFPALPPPERRLELIGEAQDICGAVMADVVFLHLRTDPVLRFEIFRSGRPVYEAEEGMFIDEKVRALMLYEDALPFRRMLRERLREDATRRGEDTHVT